jgi:hypothetical protein
MSEDEVELIDPVGNNYCVGHWSEDLTFWLYLNDTNGTLMQKYDHQQLKYFVMLLMSSLYTKIRVSSATSSLYPSRLFMLPDSKQKWAAFLNEISGSEHEK